MSDESLLQFAEDPNAEHGNILRAKSTGIEGLWEFGIRLQRFYDTNGWAKVTLITGGCKTWWDYMDRGLRMSPTSAYKYMAAARLPLWCSLQVGTEKAALLSKIIDMTADDESPEQAMDLLLPVRSKDGGVALEKMPFREMTLQQVEQAYRLLKEGQGGVARPKTPSKRSEGEALRVAKQKAAEEATAALLTSGRVSIRYVNGEFLYDLRGVPESRLSQLAAALAKLAK